MVGLRERKRVATRERIIRAAVELFGKRGIGAVTIDEIADAAEVGKGTIYNYFPTKEDIIVSFLIDLDRPLLTTLPQIAAQSQSAADALDEAAWSLMASKAEHASFVKVFLARVVAIDGFAQELHEFQQAMDRSLTGLFEGLQAKGWLAAGRSLDELILSFKTMSLGLHMLWCLEGPPFTATRAMTRRHMELFAKGMEP